MSARSAYVCQIQVCNIALVILGLAAIGLAGSQFSSVRLDNYRNIDLRLLNCIHALTGVIGFYSVVHNHSGAVAKTHYCISAAIGCVTAIFYGFATYRVSSGALNEFILNIGPAAVSILAGREVKKLFTGDGFLATLIALVSIFLLDKLVTSALPMYPMELVGIRHREPIMHDWSKILVSIAVMKLFLGTGALGLAAFVEYEHEKEAYADKHIKIALEHIAALLAVVSSLIDILASRKRRIGQLNLMVKIKDLNNDLKRFYLGKDLNDPFFSSSYAFGYTIVVAHGVLIGCFGILYFLCALSSVVVGTCLQQLDFVTMNARIDEGTVIQSRFLSILHLLWGAALLALCILGLLDVRWRGEFLGGDLLWIAILFASTGILSSHNYRAQVVTRLVMNIVCVSIAVEKMCASINLIYQYSSYEIFVRGESITVICAMGTLFYAVVITGCYVVFELGKWRYNEIPIDVPFFRIGNGPLALAAFIVQLFCLRQPWLLSVSVVLQIILASLALFTISPAITNVYLLQGRLYYAGLALTPLQITLYDTALILSSGATLACAIMMLTGTAAIQQMEEQTVYWSADENPFYYHTSKRFYGQPYQVESGAIELNKRNFVLHNGVYKPVRSRIC
ncbi:unnamed protein product [Angiostrongylus costaricensis]|uniref:Phosphate transporter n=1 Tax=Angiostrongylus costaricensis TaxID=334426 RepID=A0A158PM27_ANGCS|nr:unnamed protein product [Angiostrongylus costaricensis]